MPTPCGWKTSPPRRGWPSGPFTTTSAIATRWSRRCCRRGPRACSRPSTAWWPRRPIPPLDRVGRFGADLQRFVGILTRHGDENRTLLLAVIDEVLEHGVDAAAMNRQHTVATQLMARAGRLLAHGIETGALRRAEPAFYAAMLLGMVRAVAVTALVRGEAGIAGRSDEIVRVFLTGAAYPEPVASHPA